MQPHSFFPSPSRLRRWAALAGLCLLPALLSVAFAQPTPGDGTGVDGSDGRVSPFYRWQGALPAPGRMLRQEPLPPTLGLAGTAAQYRILYSSTDGISGQGAVAVSGALFVPAGTPPPGGWPVLAWAHGTIGMADICAPSWNARYYRDARYLETWLKEGFAIVATDYQGLGTPGPHPYLYTRPEAYSVLDSVRAVQAAHPELSKKTIIIGQSQGGGAAFATAAFAPQYAPDLQILGTVATGTPYLAPKAMAAAEKHDPREVRPQFAYLALLALNMQQQTVPHPDLAQVFSERALPLVEEARSSCIFQLEADVSYAGISDANAYKSDLMKLVMPHAQALMYPTLKLEQPLFMGIGAKDVDVSTASQLMLAEDACAAGSVVQAHLYRDHDHNGTVNGSLQDSLPFVRKLLAGEKIAPVCRPLAQ